MNQNLKKYSFILIFLPFLVAWDVYGPTENLSAVQDARVSLSGKFGVFLYKESICKPMKGWFGGPKSLVDRVSIAAYNFSTREVKVVYTQDNLSNEQAEGQGDFSFFAAYGDIVLVTQSGQGNSGHKDKTFYYWLDLGSGQMTPFLLNEELGRKNLGVGFFDFIGEQGAMALVSPPSDRVSGWRSDRSIPLKLMIRYPNGVYEDVDEIDSYYGERNGEIDYRAGDKCMAYNLNTRTARLRKPAPCTSYTIFNVKTNETTQVDTSEIRDFISSVGMRLNKDAELRIIRDKQGDKFEGCRRNNGQVLLCEDINLKQVFEYAR